MLYTQSICSTDTPGQRYVTHHDFSLADSDKPAGGRALTLLLYLSDVKEGGETYFPALDLSIQPKEGRAVLWANTLDREPQTGDDRTRHEAKPVSRGVKYAANQWIHLHDYAKADLWGCTGTF